MYLAIPRAARIALDVGVGDELIIELDPDRRELLIRRRDATIPTDADPTCHRRMRPVVENPRGDTESALPAIRRAAPAPERKP